MTWDDDINEQLEDAWTPAPYWTAQRIIFTLLILLTLIAFLLYIYGTLFFPPHPILPPFPPGTYTTV